MGGAQLYPYQKDLHGTDKLVHQDLMQNRRVSAQKSKNAYRVRVENDIIRAVWIQIGLAVAQKSSSMIMTLPKYD
jgi:hypothetical protein